MTDVAKPPMVGLRTLTAKPKPSPAATSSDQSKPADNQTTSKPSESSQPLSSPPPSLSLSTDADAHANPHYEAKSNAQPSVHPLHRPWTFLYTLPVDKQKGWGSISPIMSFQSIEEFWGVYNSLSQPTRLPLRSDLYMFVKDCQPTWEEPKNADGGRWLIEWKGNEEATVNEAWLNTLLGLIGESFSDGDEIMGVVFNNRGKKHRLQIWTKNAINRQTNERIGAEWKVMIGHRAKIGFLSHKECEHPGHKPSCNYEV